MFRKRKRKPNREEGRMLAQDVKVTFIGSEAIDSFMDKYVHEDKERCLEIGNIGPKEDFMTLDIRTGADYRGDIKGCITEDYEMSEGLASLPYGSFVVVRTVNTIEHIPWLYHTALFDWLNRLLTIGGMLYIDTPNLEFITRVYLAGLDYIAKGIEPKFPGHQYPGMANKETGETIEPSKNLQKWTQFKLFSGCSPGDYHHTCYDAYWIARVLDNAGFDKICISNEETLKVVAFKIGERVTSHMDSAMERILQGH